MTSSLNHSPIVSRTQAVRGALVVGLVCLASALPAYAEYFDGPSFETLRSPLIPGVTTTPPLVCPPEGPPPPPGDGMCPAPVTPGHLGPPCKPPSAVDLPPLGPMDKDILNGMVAPYLEPPPSTPGQDPGLLDGPAGFQPPAAWVDINPSGGIYGQAPTNRWGGQTTRDLGRPRNFGSKTSDFGQDIDEIAATQRQSSQDGPRPTVTPGQLGSQTNRQANLAGATKTQDLHGNRQLFKGPYNRSIMTIAPY